MHVPQDMNRDEAEGKVKNIGGRIKEAAGTLTGDKDLEKEGATDRMGGAIKEGFGKVKRKVGEALEDAGKHTKR